ncbi:MAG TPA: DUF192 domain-containing protein [Solirubrobacterales bacterium]|nr:DUF192 domain-containing protein [Solirubrobacterales bacterium]
MDRCHAPGISLDLSDFPVAKTYRSRLLGLSWRERSRAGLGLLIPRCASVHTFGMCFELDVYFLDRDGRVLSVRRRVPPRRFLWCRGASAVLEIPAEEGGEFRAPRALDTHAP